MSRLDINSRVYADLGGGNEPPEMAACVWFACCPNPANGLRDHPILGDVPICQRCDDRVEKMSTDSE